MTLAEKNGFTIKQEIKDLKKYLADTDYVVSKIAEKSALGLPTDELVARYQTVLQKREEARTRIDILEE